MKNIKNKKNIDEDTLRLYNILSFACGILSILLTLTGIYGIVIGSLGLFLSLVYHKNTKHIKMGFIFSLIGIILSLIFFILQMIVYFAV